MKTNHQVSSGLAKQDTVGLIVVNPKTPAEGIKPVFFQEDKKHGTPATVVIDITPEEFDVDELSLPNGCTVGKLHGPPDEGPTGLKKCSSRWDSFICSAFLAAFFIFASSLCCLLVMGIIHLVQSPPPMLVWKFFPATWTLLTICLYLKNRRQ